MTNSKRYYSVLFLIVAISFLCSACMYVSAYSGEYEYESLQSLSLFIFLSEQHRRPSRLAMRTETARPFYRDDIFYSGSLLRLPEYKSSVSLLFSFSFKTLMKVV